MPGVAKRKRKPRCEVCANRLPASGGELAGACLATSEIGLAGVTPLVGGNTIRGTSPVRGHLQAGLRQHIRGAICRMASSFLGTWHQPDELADAAVSFLAGDP